MFKHFVVFIRMYFRRSLPLSVDVLWGGRGALLLAFIFTQAPFVCPVRLRRIMHEL